MDAVLIPIIAVSTGLVAVFGRAILRPILQVLQQQQVGSTKVQELEQKIAQLEGRLAGTEVSVDTLLEEREFMRKLASGRTAAVSAGVRADAGDVRTDVPSGITPP